MNRDRRDKATVKERGWRQAGAGLGALWRVLVFVLPAFCLAACGNLGGEEYKRPDVAVKDSWSDNASTVSARETIQPGWWKGFGDPYLDQLIEEAISGNLDIRILASRTGVASAAISQAKAGLLPTITAGAGTDTIKHTASPRTTKYSAASDVVWEADIWGKVRKGVEAQEAEFRASEADWRAGYLTVVADTATAYFQIRRFDEQIDRQVRAIERNTDILEIYRSMYAEGILPKTQVLQQQAEQDRLENGLLELKRLRKLTENGLATLLGRPADTLKVPPARLTDTIKPVDVPAGLPSDLLSRRPDIIAAEFRVLQAYNLEGQARLARLPTLSLTGRGGTAAFSVSDLFKAGSFGLSSMLSFPVFDPSVRARIKVAEAQAEATENEYRRTVIGAFEEVENALTNLASHKAQHVELQGRRNKLEIVSGQMHAQLEEGVVSNLEVFETERTLLDAEQEMLANHWQVLIDTIVVFKALGGGWPSEVVGNSR